jgi:hypothetical protein
VHSAKRRHRDQDMAAPPLSVARVAEVRMNKYSSPNGPPRGNPRSPCIFKFRTAARPSRRIAAVLPIAREMVEKLCDGPVNLIIVGIVIPSA